MAILHWMWYNAYFMKWLLKMN